MAIKLRIKQDKNSDAVPLSASNIRVRTQRMAYLSTEGSTIRINSPTLSIYPAVKQDPRIQDYYHALTTVNGTRPAPGGGFFILGSACTAIEGSRIVDACPSCSACEELAQLRQATEFIAYWLNVIKDLQLESGSNASSRSTELLNELTYITEDKNLIKACKLSEDTPNKLVAELIERGTNVLKRYALTTHMWNYICTYRGAKTELAQPPEDPAGIMVTTSYSLCQCSRQGNEPLTCDIELSLNNGQTELNVYVPDPVISCSTPGAALNHKEDPITTSGTTQHVKVTIYPQSGGTYAVRQKFLPFFPVKLTYDDPDESPVILRGPEGVLDGVANYTIKEYSEKDGSFMLRINDIYSTIHNTITPISGKVTNADYNDGKIAASASDPKKNEWRIKVTWKLSNVVQTENTYIYNAFGCRKPLENALNYSGKLTMSAEEKED